MPTSFEVSMRQFSDINLQRTKTRWPHEVSDWSPTDWLNAIAVELGEAQRVVHEVLNGSKN